METDLFLRRLVSGFGAGALFLFVLFAFFDRGGALLLQLPLTSTFIVGLSSVISIAASALLLFRRRLVMRRGLLLICFAYAFFLTINLLLHANSAMFPLVFQFHMELLMCFVFIAMGYFSLSSGMITARGLIFSITLAGIGFFLFSIGEAVAGFRGHRYDFSESRNYFASAMSVIAIGAFLRVVLDFANQTFFVTIFYSASGLAALIAVFMSGSKSSLFSFFLLVAVVFLKTSRNFILIAPALLVASLLSVAYGSSEIFELIRVGVERSSFEALVFSFNQRLSIWADSISVSYFSELLFGRAYFYEIFDESYLQPHNIFIGWIRYAGLGIASIFIFLALLAIAKCFKPVLISNLRDLELTLLAFIFIIALLYTSFSGNVTRVWHFYFLLGALLGFLARNRAIDCEKSHDMIS